MALRLLVIGDIAWDIFIRPEGDLVRGSDVLGTVDVMPGGAAANVAVWARRLGAQVTLVGKIGDDTLGTLMHTHLRGEGVGDHLITVPGGLSTRVGILVSADGEHSFVIDHTKVLRFETPRGRLVVQRRDSAPAWIPPDWHYQEQANKRRLGLTQLVRGKPLPLRDGGHITVKGNDVVRVTANGAVRPLAATDGREIVADGQIIIPPFGTNQRKYADVLGHYRLYLGDGYALHGTNNPASVGQAVSHGCVRLRNEDIAALYHRVAVGTPVFIY